MKFIYLFALCFSVFFIKAQKRALITRSDSLNIVKTNITINNIDFTAKTIDANTELVMVSKIVNNTIHLDLLKLTIDSILVNNTNHMFLYNDTVITIQLSSNLLIGDTVKCRVYYRGQPQTDAQWGGFYFSGNYAFNMGVGFNSQPHNFGRVWFPCFDNFVERCGFEYFITAPIGKIAVCNGNLEDSTLNTNGTTFWHWKIEEEIPTYLASIAVSDYTIVKKQLNSIYQNKEAWIASLPIDTNKVNGSFANLQKSFDMLEEYFGEYFWNKVGYTLVPFNAGAMEHATCIHIGNAYINGTLTYETLIAHELSHHWFGNLATCRTAQDMWLNEGWASYCELLHTQYVYGDSAYNKAYKDLHYKMLNSAHIDDDGFRAISNMDSNYTYGTTVYSKGADMIHTLRNYLGDSLFFGGMKNYLSQNKFKDVTTNTLANSLTSYTGQNMSFFFDDWIKQAGFANFTIDSIHSSNNGTEYVYNIFIRQRKHKNTNYYNNVPIDFCFYKNDFSFETRREYLTNRCGMYTFVLPYEAKLITLDDRDKLSDASTTDFKTIKTTLPLTVLPYTKTRLNIKSLVNVSDSSFIRIEQHWVAPDRFKTTNNFGYVLNNVKYYNVDGVNLQNLKGSIGFLYDGRAVNNYWDSAWINNIEDSIKLFYRKDATAEWAPVNDSLVKFGNSNDKYGFVYINDIIKGDYAFAIKKSSITDTLISDAPIGPCAKMNSINSTEKQKILIYPNPSQNQFIIEFEDELTENCFLKILNFEGKTLYKKQIPKSTKKHNISCNFSKGIYLVQISNKSLNYSQKIVIE